MRNRKKTLDAEILAGGLSEDELARMTLLSKNLSRILSVAKYVFGFSIGKISSFFKEKIVSIIDLYNYQFEQEYEEDLILYLFVFNTINAHLPLLLVAVLKQFFTFRDVYISVIIFIIIKQFDVDT